MSFLLLNAKMVFAAVMPATTVTTKTMTFRSYMAETTKLKNTVKIQTISTELMTSAANIGPVATGAINKNAAAGIVEPNRSINAVSVMNNTVFDNKTMNTVSEANS